MAEQTWGMQVLLSKYNFDNHHFRMQTRTQRAALALPLPYSSMPAVVNAEADGAFGGTVGVDVLV